MVNGHDGFETWLERKFQARAAAQPGKHVMPAGARYHKDFVNGGTRVSFLAKLAALASVKAAIGLTVGVLAVSAAGEAAISGSGDPTAWGQQVSQQVQKCKAALAPGSHGIGQCVSAFAKQHGDQVSDSHQASNARKNEPSTSPSPKTHGNSGNHGNGNGNGNSGANGDGNGHGNGK